MARPYRRWIGIVAAGLLSVAVLAVGSVYAISSYKLGKVYEVPEVSLALSNDSTSLARGAHIANAVAKCVECHGENLGGKIMVQDRAFGTVTASNLTRGVGGIGDTYTTADWVRAIRHGVAPGGRGLVIMPSDEFHGMGKDDLVALVSWLQSLPPVDNELPQTRLGPVARALYVAGILPAVKAEKLDHAKQLGDAPEPGRTVAYGKYLAVVGGCEGCHGAGLSGGPMPGTPPHFPVPANITPAGLAGWTEGDFEKALREGVRPDGSQINPFMPWRLTRHLTDQEMGALWLYVQSVPAREFGMR